MIDVHNTFDYRNLFLSDVIIDFGADSKVFLLHELTSDPVTFMLDILFSSLHRILSYSLRNTEWTILSQTGKGTDCVVRMHYLVRGE